MTVDIRELPAIVRQAAVDLEGAPALDVLRWADETFGPAWCVASSMADAVLPHLASQVRPGVDVIFLDTGYHFPETIGTRDAVAATMPVTRAQHPAAADGRRAGCRVRRGTVRARPATVAAQCAKSPRWPPPSSPYQAWATGLRRDEAPTRASTQVVEWDATRSMVKLNPIAAWTQADVDAYIAEHRRPGQSSAVRRLRLGGLRALYPTHRRRGGRTGRPLGGHLEDRVRPARLTAVADRRRLPAALAERPCVAI